MAPVVSLKANESESELQKHDVSATVAETSWSTLKGLFSLIPELSASVAAWEVGETIVRELWDRTNGSKVERLQQIKQLVSESPDTGDETVDVAESQRAYQ